jgi:hypothetical protein
MKNIWILSVILLTIASVPVFSQPEYLAGTSVVSIEPEETLLSLHLGGYGAPRDGRFTLQWREIKEFPAADAFNDISFKTDENGKILIKDRKGKSWLVAGSADFNGIASIAANKGRHYLLTNDGTLYWCEPSRSDAKWLKMAYRNGETIKEEIVRIAIIKDRLYATDKNNKKYIAENRSDGDLTSRALAIRQGKVTTLIINIDVCGLDDEFTGPVKNEIFKKTGIPASAIFINSSHTHFAPVSQNWLTWQEANQRPDSIFLNKTIRNGLVKSSVEAVAALKPAEIWFGRGKTDIGYNRSLKDNQELYDSALDVLKIFYPETSKESYLFIAACHPVFSTAGTLHFTISANYPGVARRLVERRTNTSNSLFLQGTAGDINPRDNGENITGEKLANEVIAVLKRPMEKISGPISCFLDTINIPIKPWSREEIIAYREENLPKKGDVYAEKNVKWSNLMLKYYDEGTMPQTLPVYVQTINIGNWKLIGYSRETTTEYGFGVKQLWPDKLVSVAGYTNDVSSYLPTSKHITLKNYEGLDSFFWYGSPAVFPMDVYDIILGAIKEKSR